jgi:hypothetical protein
VAFLPAIKEKNYGVLWPSAVSMMMGRTGKNARLLIGQSSVVAFDFVALAATGSTLSVLGVVR